MTFNFSLHFSLGGVDLLPYVCVNKRAQSVRTSTDGSCVRIPTSLTTKGGIFVGLSRGKGAAVTGGPFLSLMHEIFLVRTNYLIKSLGCCSGMCCALPRGKGHGVFRSRPWV